MRKNTERGDSLVTILSFLGLVVEVNDDTEDEINDCSHGDVTDCLQEDYLGEINLYDKKLKALNGSCSCFKIGNCSLTLI